MRKRFLLVPVLVLGLLAVTSAPGRRAISVAVLDLARGGTIGGSTTVSGDLTVNGDAGVSNNARVTGTFGVTGAATFGTIVSAPILDGGAVIGTTGNFSGDITADHYHSTALPTENSFYVPAQTYYCGNTPTCTANFQFDGAAWAFTPDFHGQDAGFNRATFYDVTTTAGSGVANVTMPAGGRLYVDATRYISGGGTTIDLTGGVVQGTSGFSTANSYASTATSGNQFACSGAATCNLQGASGQTTAVDCGGGTCTASLGTTNATTTTVGRSGAATNIDGALTLSNTITVSDAKTLGSITLNTGTGTATVNSGAICFCQDVTANASVRCAVASTTLTATGTGSDVIKFWCPL